MSSAETYKSLEFDVLLEQLAAYAGCELTREAIRSVEVDFAPAQVDKKLDQTAEALCFLEEQPSVELPSFALLEDQTDTWDRVAAGELIDSAQARGLLCFLEVCSSFDSLLEHMPPGKFHLLNEVAASWNTLQALYSRTKRIFNEEGEVRDSASPALAKIRTRLRTFEGEVLREVGSLVDSIQEQTGEESHLTIRNNRFVVLMPRSMAGRFRGSIVDISGSGQSIYFEPEGAGKLNAERQHLFLEEDKEVRQVLREYGAGLAANLSALKADLAVLVEFDHIFARSRYARALKASRPKMSANGGFTLRGAIHPLLYKDFVPEHLAFEDERALIISGVNAGGKTVLLKLLGLYSLMAALGCYVPAEARLPYISGLHADIGDEQSTLANLSTFTAHLRFVSELWKELGRLKRADPPLLVLIDEIGTGTEPGEGAAFAYGLITALLKKPVKLAVTTHYEVLKTLAFEYDAVKNVCLEFDQEKLAPTFRVLDNQPGQSFALQIAQRWGTDQAVLSAARGVLGKEEQKMVAVIGELEKLRREAEDIRGKLAAQASELERSRGENEALNLQLKQAKQRFAQETAQVKVELERRIDELLSETKKKLKRKARQSARKQEEYVKAASKSAAVVRKQKAEAQEAVGELLKPLAITEEELVPVEGQPQVGEIAVLHGSSVRGEVLEVNPGKGEAVLEVQGKRLSVSLKKLTRLAAVDTGFENAPALPRTPERRNSRLETSFVEGLAGSSDTLELHGQTVEEASETLEEFISNCLANNISTIRLMHGVGTGRLRAFIRDYLRRHKHIENVRHAGTHDGGVGVTLADLK
ncbi:Smr/MutS family protein [bacterium]|nr:Smr/MutS family protein [bacterium]